MAAPKTVKTYDLDGSLRDFEIPFDYLARKFIVVTLLGQDRRELVLNTDYRFSQRTVITTTSAWGPADGYERIEIKRVTSATERLVDFSDGSVLRAIDLNTATVQALHIAEEGRDIATDTIGVDNNGNLDARGRRIVNLADAVNPGDAVSLRQLQEFDNSALNSAIAAKGSADKAKASETNAKLSEDKAKASETNAKLSEDKAKVSETNSKLSEDNAKVSEDKAKVSELAAAVSSATAKSLSDRFLAPRASNPATRDDGSPLQIGDRYLNTTVPGLEMIYKSTGWEANNLDMSILSGSTGALNVGYLSRWGARTTVSTALDMITSPEMFGALGDDISNDRAAFASAMEMIGKAGGGTLRLTSGKKYFIDGTVIIPEFVQIDLNGCTVRGNRNDSVGTTMFVSGYFNTSGVLVSNLGSLPEARMLDGIRVFNGKFLNVYRVFQFRNANRTCAIGDIVFINCAQAWDLQRSFSMALNNTFGSDGSLPNVPFYSFTGGASNSIVLNQIRAVTGWGFYFEGGADSVVLLNCDFEGGYRGFVFTGAIRAIRVVGGYFENVRGAEGQSSVLWDISGVTDGSISWSGTYNWLIDTLVNDPINTGAIVEGHWDDTNSILGPGFVESGHTFNQWIYARASGNRIKYDLQGNVGSADTAFPYFFVNDGNISTTATQVVRLGNRKALRSSGGVPVRVSGDVGTETANVITGCTHQPFQPGVASIVVLVDTKIAYREGARVTFNITVTDASGPKQLAGDIYGALVRRADALSNTVDVSSNNGMLRIQLYGFAAPGGVYTARGSIQLLA